MAEAAQIYNDAFNAGLRPDPDLTVTEWADEYRYLSKKASAEHGKYYSDRTPYMKEIMDCLSPSSPVEEVVTMMAAQIGKTTAMENWLGYIVDMCGGSLRMVFPTADLAKIFSKQKLAPMIEVTPRIKAKIMPSRSRDSGNTLLTKEFTGGILTLVGSNSGSSFRQTPAGLLCCDDLDEFEADIAGQGDPVDLLRKRANTYGIRY